MAHGKTTLTTHTQSAALAEVLEQQIYSLH